MNFQRSKLFKVMVFFLAMGICSAWEDPAAGGSGGVTAGEQAVLDLLTESGGNLVTTGCLELPNGGTLCGPALNAVTLAAPANEDLDLKAGGTSGEFNLYEQDGSVAWTMNTAGNLAQVTNRNITANIAVLNASWSGDYLDKLAGQADFSEGAAIAATKYLELADTAAITIAGTGNDGLVADTNSGSGQFVNYVNGAVSNTGFIRTEGSIFQWPTVVSTVSLRSNSAVNQNNTGPIITAKGTTIPAGFALNFIAGTAPSDPTAGTVSMWAQLSANLLKATDQASTDATITHEALDFAP